MNISYKKKFLHLSQIFLKKEKKRVCFDWIYVKHINNKTFNCGIEHLFLKSLPRIVTTTIFFESGIKRREPIDWQFSQKLGKNKGMDNSVDINERK